VSAVPNSSRSSSSAVAATGAAAVTGSTRVVSAGATHAAQGEMLVRAALGLVESALVNDVITEVNGQEVRSAADLAQSVSPVKGKKSKK